MGVCDYIPRGAANAITAERIAEYMSLDVRVVQRLIQAERGSGTPICARTTVPQGFFLADNERELWEYVESLKRRLRSIFITYCALSETLDTMSGQGRINEFFDSNANDVGGANNDTGF